MHNHLHLAYPLDCTLKFVIKVMNIRLTFYHGRIFQYKSIMTPNERTHIDIESVGWNTNRIYCETLDYAMYV